MKKMYYNKEYRKAFKKSDCLEDLGSEETFIVHEAEFCSDISQDDADRKAEEFAEKEGPLYANKVGGCCEVYYNTRQEGDFFKNDCPDGQKQEQPTHHVVEAGRVWSKFSTEIANYEAAKILEQEGQAAANESGVCKTVYYNEDQHGWFSKRCKEGWKAPEKYRRIYAGTVTSFISADDANEKAKKILEEEGMKWVNENTKCEPVVDECKFDF